MRELINFATEYSNKFDNFIKHISEKHDIPENVLLSYWNNDIITPLSNTPVSTPVSTPKSDSSIPKTIDTCNYVYSRGNKKGMRCTKKPKNGGYCGLHKKSQKAIKSPIKPNTIIEKPKLILKCHPKYKQFYYHLDTNLLFNKNKFVIGKIDEEGNKADLDDISIKLCQEWKFKYMEK